MKTRAKPRKRKESSRYATAQRLHALKLLLNSSGGASLYDIAERMEISLRTAIRYLEALRRAGEPLYDETVGKRKVWRLMPSARHQSVTLTTSQMLSLFLSRRVFDFLEGTGFKEDLDDVFRRLEVTLKRQDAASARNLDRKIFDVNEAPHLYADRLEHVNEILTALLKEQRLSVLLSRRRRPFLLDPYTLLVYKKGLYLAGWSHEHKAIRTFALDGFAEVEWLKGNAFEYPADFHPSQLYEGAFGLIGGEPVRVRIRFTEKVARFVKRRRWHPTQKLTPVEGGLELVMDVRGTAEVTSWVLSFGRQASVLEPESLRTVVREELRDAEKLYDRE